MPAPLYKMPAADAKPGWLERRSRLLISLGQQEAPRMKCPIDGIDLVMSERQGIEIDYCPTCRGVWLDRGELDKIIERAAAEDRSAPARAAAPRDDDRRYDDDRYRQPERRDDRYDDRRPYKKKRKSLLDDLFDF
jgi:Zn-finger nucleic acid-binding protein